MCVRASFRHDDSHTASMGTTAKTSPISFDRTETDQTNCDYSDEAGTDTDSSSSTTSSEAYSREVVGGKSQMSA